MNRLIEKNPMAVEIDGIEYPLNTDFRDCLKIILAFEDKSLMLHEQQNILLENLYGDLEGNLPTTLNNFEKAYELGCRFLDRDNDFKVTKVKEQSYSLTIDGEDILAGILNKPNGINLANIEYLHWWDFMLQFMGIGEGSFSTKVYLRNQAKKGKLSKEERKQCEDIGWNIINMVNNSKEEIQAIEDYINSD